MDIIWCQNQGYFNLVTALDDQNLAQIKVMLASLDPLGMPLATKVVSGEQADDGLYLPILEQVSQNLGQSGLLWVGDCKMSSQETRGYIHRQQDYYLSLKTATAKIQALTPPPGRGKRQIRDQSTLDQKVQAILKAHRVEGLLEFDYEYQSPSPPRQARYQITAITPNKQSIEQAQLLFGWRVYVTNAPQSKLSLKKAVLTYRDEWLIERNFGRFKGVPLSITPFFVQRDDQVQGLVHLLSLAVRLLSLIEFVVRRHLQPTGESLKGLYPGNPTRATARPTTEKLLKAFDNLTLTLIQTGGEWYGDVTPLNPLQSKILTFLGLSPEIYSGLVENST